MKILTTTLPGVLLFRPIIREDKRGFFWESFNKQHDLTFVQSNVSVSHQNVLRGLHAQKKKPQGKLVSVLNGFIYDVAVDIKTGKWAGFYLSAGEQIYVPPGYYHGFYSQHDNSIIEYKCTEYYDPKDEIGVIWNDKKLNIEWPVPHPFVSEKDAKLPNFS